MPEIISVSGVPPIGVGDTLLGFHSLFVDVNGNYLETNVIVNGQPVFVKVDANMQFSHENICLRASVGKQFWAFHPCCRAYDGSDIVCQILVPAGCSLTLRDIAESGVARVSVYKRDQDRLIYHTSRVAVVLRGGQPRPAVAELGAGGEVYDCYICSQTLPFATFRVPECGHIICDACYQECCRRQTTCPTCRKPFGISPLTSDIGPTDNIYLNAPFHTSLGRITERTDGASETV